MNESQHREANVAKWDAWAATLDGTGWKSEYLRRAQRSVIDLMEIGENPTVLDVGCGTGWALGQIAALRDGKGEYYGIDLSAKMIAKAIQNFQGKRNFHFVQAASDTIPLPADFADAIICTNSFHHYYDPGKALREMRRLLKRGGRTYILDPTADNLIARIWDRAARLLDRSHGKFYSTQEFREMIVASGLTYVGKQEPNIIDMVHIGEK